MKKLNIIATLALFTNLCMLANEAPNLNTMSGAKQHLCNLHRFLISLMACVAILTWGSE
jgi:hypothetical protein